MRDGSKILFVGDNARVKRHIYMSLTESFGSCELRRLTRVQQIVHIETKRLKFVREKNEPVIFVDNEFSHSKALWLAKIIYYDI